MCRDALIAKYGADAVELCSELPDGYTRQQVVEHAAREVATQRRVVQKYESGKQRGHRFGPEARAKLEQAARERLAWWRRELEINAVLAENGN